MDAAFITKCADPSLAPAIVERFVATAGAEDPLAISVKADGRLILIPKPRAASEALEVVRTYVGQAVVRVGITQFPAGIGIADASQLRSGIFEACENLRTGTALFAKVARIVTKWYGRPTNKELLPQMFDDAIDAWKTGAFEGSNVFSAEDPGGPTFIGKASGDAKPSPEPQQPAETEKEESHQLNETDKPAEAGIRVDLSRITGQK